MIDIKSTMAKFVNVTGSIYNPSSHCPLYQSEKEDYYFYFLVNG